MLNISNDSRDTLHRISLIDRAKPMYSHLKYHELFNHIMSMTSANLTSFEKSLLKSKPLYLVDGLSQAQDVDACIAKPTWFYDDLPGEEILAPHIRRYKPFKEKI